MTCKMTKAQQDTFSNLINNFNSARQDIENFLTELKDDWEDDLQNKSESYQESQAGQDAQERIDTLDGWMDEVANDFEPDISEVF